MSLDSRFSGDLEKAQRAYLSRDFELSIRLLEDFCANTPVPELQSSALHLLISQKLVLQDYRGLADVVSSMSPAQIHEFAPAIAYFKALTGDQAGSSLLLQKAQDQRQTEFYALAAATIAELEGDFAESARIRRALADSNPEQPGYLLQLAQLYVRMGRSVDADYAFREATSRAPNDVHILGSYAIFLIGRKRIEAARKLIDQCTELNPDLLTTKQALATLLLHEKRYQESLRVCESIAIEASNPEVQALSARCLYGLGQRAEAMVVASNNLRDHPRNVTACRAFIDCAWKRKPLRALSVFWKFCLTGAGA